MKAQTLTVQDVAIDTLRPHPDNPRQHNSKQLRKIARSIDRYGFTNPILIADDGVVIAGHGRLEAAKVSGLVSVPAIRLSGLSPDEHRALMLADNQIALESDWNHDRLAKVLSDLVNVDFEIEDTGFDTADVDLILSHDGAPIDEADIVESLASDRPIVAQHGDLFVVGEHRLYCGDALEPISYEAVLAGSLAAMAFTDPPYNVPIAGNVSGRGRVRHGEFVQASGEMSEAAYARFLATMCAHLVRFTQTGSIVDVCIDWRHVGALLGAAQDPLALKNLCVWVKDNGGQGSLYRSQHEFVLVFKNGAAAHVNNVELGKRGRNRTNVWRYPGVNTFRRGRLADLEAHPTVKPVAMVADAILDCSRIGDVVLDPFAGSGTILLACERTQRRAAAVELNPAYVDAALRRFEQRTGIIAIHASSGLSFSALAAARGSTSEGK